MNIVKTLFFAVFMILASHVSADSGGGSKDSTTTKNSGSAEPVGVKRAFLKMNVSDINPNADMVNYWDSINLAPYPFYYPYFKDSLMYFNLDSNSFVHPCGSRGGTITSTFEARSLFGRKFHKGIDIDLETGDTVYAIADGRIRFSKFNNGYGNVVVISHMNNLAGLESLYGHLDERFVSTMEFVHQGQAIGLGGSTGQSTGSHLHAEFRIFGKSIDPLWMIDTHTFMPIMSIVYVTEKWVQYIDEYGLE